MTYHYGVGDLQIDEIVGSSIYQIAGNPIVALLAQLNRFAGKKIKIGTESGDACKARIFVARPYRLVPTLTDEQATIANIMMHAILTCVGTNVRDFKQAKKVSDGVLNAVGWATQNAEYLTIQFAQLGDLLGLDAATVGITRRDPRVTPKFPTTAVLVVGLALGAMFVLKRRQS